MVDPRSKFPNTRGNRGVSMVEVLVTITIVSLFTAIAVPIYNNVRESAVTRVAQQNEAWLNEAVDLYNATVGRISNAADDASLAEEGGVVALLTATSPPSGILNVAGGFPFLRPSPTIVEPAGTDIPRYRWNGHHFEMIPAGEEGKGFVLSRASTGT